jgi:hypothetical protein
MQIARGSRGIEPVCLRNGLNVAISLAVPQAESSLRRVFYMFLFQST